MLSPESASAHGPDWKLDRRGSGRLFWRRDSSCAADPASRVKFRYDVEVLEYWETEDPVPSTSTAADASAASDDCNGGFDSASTAAAGVEDAQPERREALRARKTPEPAPPLLLCVACVGAIALMICYQWMLSG